MISPTMEIQWMKVRDESVRSAPVFDLFKECSHQVMCIKNEIKEIRFNPGELKITDWRGWTDVEYIRKIEDPFPLWLRIQAGDQFVIISHGESIPVYDDIIPQSGFHGASRFSYQLKIPQLINQSADFVRVRRGTIDGAPTEFIHPIVSKAVDERSTFGYEIGTKSGFFNCNNFHLFASDDIPEKMEVSR